MTVDEVPKKIKGYVYDPILEVWWAFPITNPKKSILDKFGHPTSQLLEEDKVIIKRKLKELRSGSNIPLERT